MNDMAKALGVGHQIDFEGKAYLLDGWTLRVIAGYEQWLKAQVWAEVESERPLVEQGLLSPALYAERHAAISKLIASRDYRYGGSVFSASMNTVEGRKQLVYLMLWNQDQDVTHELVERMWHEKEVELLARAMEMAADPNPKTPGTAAAETASPSSPSSPESSTNTRPTSPKTLAS